MKMWILGGTSESVALVEKLDPRCLIVSVVSEEGAAFLPEGTQVAVGAMDFEAMCRFIEREAIVAAIDMTHPFAHEVSRIAQAAAKKQHVPYYRHHRAIQEGVGDYIFSGYEDCARFIEAREGTFFFTTGSKHVDLFQSVRGTSRHIYRVIPSEKSIGLLKAAGVAMEDMVAILGPIDYGLNCALFDFTGANYLVTKNSGTGSGFREKIEAARDRGLISLVIDAERETGYSFQEIVQLTERISHEILPSILHQ